MEITDVSKRMEKVFTLLENEITILNTEKDIHSRVKDQMDKNQKEYYLNEQIKAIQKELGELRAADGGSMCVLALPAEPMLWAVALTGLEPDELECREANEGA